MINDRNHLHLCKSKRQPPWKKPMVDTAVPGLFSWYTSRNCVQGSYSQENVSNATGNADERLRSTLKIGNWHGNLCRWKRSTTKSKSRTSVTLNTSWTQVGWFGGGLVETSVAYRLSEPLWQEVWAQLSPPGRPWEQYQHGNQNNEKSTTPGCHRGFSSF